MRRRRSRPRSAVRPGHDVRSLETRSAHTGTLVARRRLFGLFAGAAGTAVLASCGLAAATRGNGSTATTTTTTAGTGTLTETPEETAGPYPADGSNGANVLTQSGVVRSDIRSSFGSSTTTAPGVPLTIKLDRARHVAAPRCPAPPSTSGTATATASYSMYTVPNENYLRGVQETDADGSVTFTSIFPACYSGRWPHIHYEVYPSLSAATSAGEQDRHVAARPPRGDCDVVYATSGYEQSVSNMSRVSLSTRQRLQRRLDLAAGDDVRRRHRRLHGHA